MRVNNMVEKYHGLEKDYIYVNELKEIWKEKVNTGPDYLYLYVVGGQGSGKSTVSMALADIIDPNFRDNYKEKIVFTAPEFFHALSKDFEEGSCIVWDETTVGASAHESQTKRNTNLRKVFDTMRRNNYCIIMNSPTLKVEKQIREELSFVIHARGMDVDTEENLITPYKIDKNPTRIKGDPYQKVPRVEGVNLPGVKCRNLWIDRAPEEVLEWYEPRRDMFQNRLQEVLAEEEMPEWARKLDVELSDGGLKKAIDEMQKEKQEKKQESKGKTKKKKIKEEIGKHPDKPLKKVASDLDVSYNYVRRISGQMKG